jgi:hypothetical protein
MSMNWEEPLEKFPSVSGGHLISMNKRGGILLTC